MTLCLSGYIVLEHRLEMLLHLSVKQWLQSSSASSLKVSPWKMWVQWNPKTQHWGCWLVFPTSVWGDCLELIKSMSHDPGVLRASTLRGFPSCWADWTSYLTALSLLQSLTCKQRQSWCIPSPIHLLIQNEFTERQLHTRCYSRGARLYS